MNVFQSMPVLIKNWAEKNPDKKAVIAGESFVTYQELWNGIKSVAKKLENLHLQKGELVLVQGTDSAQFIMAFYGVQISGGVALITARRPTEESQKELIEKTGARIFIGEDAAYACDTEFLSYSDIYSWDIFSENYCFPEATDPVDIIFTTGTTGKPKGVLHGASVAVKGAENLVLGSGYTEDVVYLVYAPMNHVFGLRKVDAVLYVGGTIVFCDGLKNLKLFFAAFEEHGVNAFHLLPSAARTLFALSRDRLGKYAEQIRFVESGAEPFAEADRERLLSLLPNTKLYFGYGSSEADNMTKYCYSEYMGLQGCVGKPMKNAKIRFVDESGETMIPTEDHPGYVVCGGPTVMLGYYNEPELTAEVLNNGWLKTSDLGYIDENGFLRLVGRKGDVVNVGGIKVSCSELEELASKNECVCEAACIAAEDKLSGQVPKLFVTLYPEKNISETELKAWLGRYVEHYKLPRKIVFMEELPHAENGKILKKELM